MKKLNIKSSTTIVLLGVALSLFSLVILFSHGTPFEFLTVAICASFGFIGFWILTPFLFILGLYISFRKKLIQFKLGLSLWGIFIVVLSLLVITSNWGNTEIITFNNCVALLKEHTPFDPFANPSIGGGFFGYVLAGILNSALTLIGTSIVCWILFVVGVVLIFNKQVVLLFKKIKNHKSNPKHAKNESHNEIEVIEEYDGDKSFSLEANAPETKQDVDQAVLRSMVMHSFNNTHGFQKATFSFGEQKQQTTLEQPSFQAGQFVQEEAPTPVVEPSVEPTFEEPPAPSFEKPAFSFENEEIKEEQPEPMVQPSPVQTAPVVEEQNVDPLHRPQPKAVVTKPYSYPDKDLLTPHENADDMSKNDESCAVRTEIINQVFSDLGVGATVVGHTIGPSVTRFDVKMNSNVSVNAMLRYVDDIGIRLDGIPVRFEKMVLGKATSGLEIQNAIRTNVGLFESIKTMEERNAKPMEIIFGKNVSGELITANLTKFPHMLVAGTTGSGKSIFMHATILTLIMRNDPESLKLMLIDPKKVEMSYYRNIPHLLCPNISDPRKANVALNKLVIEMERRYNLFESSRVRDIGEFNDYAKANGLQKLPYIVVFVDEYADLSEACKEVRTPVVRIAQKARSAGIHLVIATQRPSVNVIDGVIKANVPVHVALMTSSATDSVTIIGEGGAEKLLGNGDMLIECSLVSRSTKPRVQGCFVDSTEINKVCDFIRSQNQPQYDPYFMDLDHDPNEQSSDRGGSATDAEVTKVDKNMEEEKLYEVIKQDISDREYCSISFLTRSYGIGFPKAGRLFAKLVREGYVDAHGDARGSKVLIRTPRDNQQIGSIEQSEFIPNDQLEESNDEPVEDSSYEEQTENYPENE